MPSYQDPAQPDFDRDMHIEMCLGCVRFKDMGLSVTCYEFQERASSAARKLSTLFKQQPGRPELNYGIPKNLPLMVNAVLANVERGSITYNGE